VNQSDESDKSDGLFADKQREVFRARQGGRTIAREFFGYIEARCRMWIPPEVKDPVLRHHPTRKSVGYFSAVRLRDGKFIFARELNRFDAMTTWNFLRLLQRRSLIPW
jgi:hypothetical protein